MLNKCYNFLIFRSISDILQEELGNVNQERTQGQEFLRDLQTILADSTTTTAPQTEELEPEPARQEMSSVQIFNVSFNFLCYFTYFLL